MLIFPPAVDEDLGFEGPAEADELACGAAERAAFLVAEAAVALGLAALLGAGFVLADAVRESNRGTIGDAADEVVGRDSILCLFTESAPFDIPEGPEIAGAEVGTARAEVDSIPSVVVPFVFDFGALLLSC